METLSFTCQDCGCLFERPASTVAFFAKQKDGFHYRELTSRCTPCNRQHIAKVLSDPALRQVIEALAAPSL